MKKILIVDDSPAVRRSLRVLLRQRPNWRVCGEAENGLEGVEKAKELRPDLVVLDLSMPLMNGLQTARELRKLMPQLPILMFTTFESSLLEREARAAGVDAIHSKSAGVDSLVESIHGLLQAE